MGFWGHIRVRKTRENTISFALAIRRNLDGFNDKVKKNPNQLKFLPLIHLQMPSNSCLFCNFVTFSSGYLV